MRFLAIHYSHEFISNKVIDELILHDIWDYKKIELEIIEEINRIFFFNIGKNKNINKLSGGQRSITYLVTLSFILKKKNIKNLSIKLHNIIESLSAENGSKLLRYMNKRGINVT